MHVLAFLRRLQLLPQMAKQRPNVLVTGTPGTGKSTTCEQIAEATGLQYVDVGGIVKSQELHSGWDDEFSCYIIDEDKVIHALLFFLRLSFLSALTLNLTSSSRIAQFDDLTAV